jgi:hypothetical protein
MQAGKTGCVHVVAAFVERLKDQLDLSDFAP